ncbi:MAG TPA: type II toxin-antitoxin system prevent-host-death family antitoxin [Kiritimatiellia bacterium]|jgi:prevent-host-death family protein
MKLLTVRELRNQSARVWAELRREQEMVITSNGKPVALLTPLGEEDLLEQVAASRRARAMVSVMSMQERSVREGRDKLSAAEIEREIAAARAGRRPR